MQPLSENAEALLRSIREGSCVAFVGSGPSKHLYPGWAELVERLCAACGVAPPLGDDREDADVLLRKAHECRQANEAAYCAELLAIFGGVPDVPHIYHQLARLPFRSYVTTNFDPLLRTALQHIPGKCDGVYTYPALPYAIGRVRLFHIHGLVEPGVVPDADQIVLGEEDFARAYSETGSTLWSFLHQLLTFTTCFFVGMGLREPELRRLFLACHSVKRRLERDRPGIQGPRHYVVLPMLYRRLPDPENLQERDLAAEGAEDRRFEELGVSVIRYEPLDERYRGLIGLLEQWLELPALPVRSGFEPESIT